METLSHNFQAILEHFGIIIIIIIIIIMEYVALVLSTTHQSTFSFWCQLIGEIWAPQRSQNVIHFDHFVSGLRVLYRVLSYASKIHKN